MFSRYARIDKELETTANKLSLRYPKITIEWALLLKDRPHEHNPVQNMRYLGTLDQLKECGLVTEHMIEKAEAKELSRNVATRTEHGDYYILEESRDRSAIGQWTLIVYTPNYPDDRCRGGTNKAKQVLRRIMKAAYQ